MTTDERAGTEQQTGREELAFLLPFFGTLLLVPPLVNLFVGRRLILFGLPLEILYLFAVWLLIIVGTLVLSWCRPFSDPLAPGAEQPPAGPGPAEARPDTGRAAGGGENP